MSSLADIMAKAPINTDLWEEAYPGGLFQEKRQEADINHWSVEPVMTRVAAIYGTTFDWTVGSSGGDVTQRFLVEQHQMITKDAVAFSCRECVVIRTIPPYLDGGNDEENVYTALVSCAVELGQRLGLWRRNVPVVHLKQLADPIMNMGIWNDGSRSVSYRGPLPEAVPERPVRQRPIRRFDLSQLE